MLSGNYVFEPYPFLMKLTWVVWIYFGLFAYGRSKGLNEASSHRGMTLGACTILLLHSLWWFLVPHGSMSQSVVRRVSKFATNKLLDALLYYFDQRGIAFAACGVLVGFVICAISFILQERKSAATLDESE